MTNIPLFHRPVSWLSAILLDVFRGLWLPSSVLDTIERAMKQRARRGEG